MEPTNNKSEKDQPKSKPIKMGAKEKGKVYVHLHKKDKKIFIHAEFDTNVELVTVKDPSNNQEQDYLTRRSFIELQSPMYLKTIKVKFYYRKTDEKGDKDKTNKIDYTLKIRNLEAAHFYTIELIDKDSIPDNFYELSEEEKEKIITEGSKSTVYYGDAEDKNDVY